jgi:hypothetical protein
MARLVIVSGSRWMRLICGNERYHKLLMSEGVVARWSRRLAQFQKRTTTPERMVWTISQYVKWLAFPYSMRLAVDGGRRRSARILGRPPHP